MKRESRPSRAEVFFRLDEDETLPTDEDIERCLKLPVAEGECAADGEVLEVTFVKLLWPMDPSTEEEVTLLATDAGTGGLVDVFRTTSVLETSDFKDKRDTGDDFIVSERATLTGTLE